MIPCRVQISAPIQVREFSITVVFETAIELLFRLLEISKVHDGLKLSRHCRGTTGGTRHALQCDFKELVEDKDLVWNAMRLPEARLVTAPIARHDAPPGSPAWPVPPWKLSSATSSSSMPADQPASPTLTRTTTAGPSDVHTPDDGHAVAALVSQSRSSALQMEY
jgi:hypothetical protein